MFSCRRESLLLFMRVGQRQNFRAGRELRKISSNNVSLLYSELEKRSNLSLSSHLVRVGATVNSSLLVWKSEFFPLDYSLIPQEGFPKW